MNLHSYNGLDTLSMILAYSNGDIDFEPLVKATEELMFTTDDIIRGWIIQHFVQNLDEIHLTLAAFYHVCRQKDFAQFSNSLS